MDIRKLLNIVTENNEPFKLNFEVVPIRRYLKESQHEQLDEKLQGVPTQNLSLQDLKDYLDRILRGEKDPTDKYHFPYVHKSNIPVASKPQAQPAAKPQTNQPVQVKEPVSDKSGHVNDGDVEELPFLKGIINQDTGQEINLQEFYKLITGRPTRMLKQNEKMQHSDGTSDMFFNIGLPAIKGLVGDEDVGPPKPGSEDKSFLMINTCPSAGACKIFCYVGKGGYVQWKASSLGMTRMLNFLYNKPEQFMSQLAAEIAETQKKFAKKGTNVVIRWHDAGDFFSPEYVKMAYEVAKKFPDITFYAYTKMMNVAQGETPENFVMNYSFGGKSDKKMDRTKVKHSDVVPKEMFNDLVVREKIPLGKINKKTGKEETKSVMKYKDEQSIQELKNRIAKAYNLDPKSFLTYDEYVKTPRSDEKNKWNVIVKPGDGDVAASRRDVLGSYLLVH